MSTYTLAWGKKVPLEFITRVVQLSENLKWSFDHCSWLMSCMAFETGETFSPSIRNSAGSGAVGLIQFMPATAEFLGTTTNALGDMTAEAQLKYVEAYFKPYAHRVKDLSSMYMAILYPKHIDAPNDTVVFSKGKAYTQNAGLDYNKDGAVTKMEVCAKIELKHKKGMLEKYALRF